MSSKSEKIEDFITQAVRDAIAETAFGNAGDADALRRCGGSIASKSAARIAWDKYRMRELQDIMDWKKPREV